MFDHDVNAPTVSQKWEKLSLPAGGFVTFLRTSLNTLSGFGVGVSIVGGMILLFPAILATLGAATTAIVFAPALLLAVLAGYSEYRKTQKVRAKAQELKDELKALMNQLNAELGEMHARIHHSLVLLGIEKSQYDSQSMDNDMPPTEKLALITASLQAIENSRKVSGQTDYKEDSYKELVKRYNEVNPLAPYDTAKNAFSLPEKTGFFKDVYQGVKGFFTGLNSHRKKNGWWSATRKFFVKAWGIALPFLGGVGLGLALGSVVIGVTTMALGMGASFTGIGAIGGVPAIAAGAVLIATALGCGLLFAGIKLYTARKQEQRTNDLEAAKAIFVQAKVQDEALKNELDKREKHVPVQKSEKTIKALKNIIKEQQNTIEGLQNRLVLLEKDDKANRPEEKINEKSLEGYNHLNIFKKAKNDIEIQSFDPENKNKPTKQRK